MIKAIFFDVDGTLISFTTHKMPESTKKALFMLKEKGIKLFVATGRPKIDIEKVQELVEFPFDGYISTNGQFCYDDKKQEIYKKFIEKESVKTILNFLKKRDLACHVITENEVFVTKYNDKVYDLFKLVGYEENLLAKPEEYCFDKEVFQLCPYISEEEEIELMKHVENCENFRWCDLFVDVIPKNGGKAIGIKKICDYYSIKPEETMAFGDGGNDIDMLKFVQIGVAMGNAGDNVKEKADYVTSHVDEDGIFNALNYFNLLS